MRDTQRSEALRLPPPLLLPVLAGALAALAGGYWDDAWHTERGRDSFVIAPHLAIYGGVTVVGAALALWLARAARDAGPAAALGQRSLRLALLGVSVTLLSAPADNAWHVAFGRDAVIWSPPHTLGIVGMAVLAVAVLVELHGRSESWARRAEPVAGALVLTALGFLVVEYETDVPQFTATWYLPVLAAASGFALAIVRSLSRRPWAATEAAAVHLALIALVALLLLALGYDSPRLPALVIPAAALDRAARRGARAAARALAYVAVLFAAYLAVVDGLDEGVHVSAAQAAAGLPVALAGVAVIFAAVFGLRLSPPPAGRRAGALAATLLVLLVAPAAHAHDPGQGESAGTMRLLAGATGRTIALEARWQRASCGGVREARLVARRARRTLSAPLTRDDCRFEGRVRVPEGGRWFVYAELHRRGDVIESWLPVKVGGAARVVEPRRYAYVSDRAEASAAKYAAGGAIYAAVLALFGAVVLEVRATARRRPGAPADAG